MVDAEIADARRAHLHWMRTFVTSQVMISAKDFRTWAGTVKVRFGSDTAPVSVSLRSAERTVLRLLRAAEHVRSRAS